MPFQGPGHPLEAGVAGPDSVPCNSSTSASSRMSERRYLLRNDRAPPLCTGPSARLLSGSAPPAASPGCAKAPLPASDSAAPSPCPPRRASDTRTVAAPSRSAPRPPFGVANCSWTGELQEGQEVAGCSKGGAQGGPQRWIDLASVDNSPSVEKTGPEPDDRLRAGGLEVAECEEEHLNRVQPEGQPGTGFEARAVLSSPRRGDQRCGEKSADETRTTDRCRAAFG